jgi:phosphotriesterase-related protein
LSADELTELFIQDITEGVDQCDYSCPLVKRTTYKAGMIKLATGDDRITDHQHIIFKAVVNAHLRTGAPILTHTNGGKLAVEQAELFLKLGADLKHVVISHVDKERDLTFHRELMQTGVSVEYDSHFRFMTKGDDWTYRLLEKMLPDYSGQIVVGMDMAKNTYWKSYGGKPGLTYLLTEFRNELKSRGLNGYFEKMFFANPQKLYAFKDPL